MAQSSRKRRSKHRGTPAGTVESRGRTGKGGTPAKARNRQEAKAIARQKRLDRLDQPPTWKGSVTRAAIAAVMFAALSVVAFGFEPVAAIPLGFVMFGLYIPLGYMTDTAIYRFRQRRKT